MFDALVQEKWALLVSLCTYVCPCVHTLLVLLFLAEVKAELHIWIDSKMTSEEAQAGMNQGGLK